MTVLIDAGFTDTAALHALGVLCNYALGFAAAQALAAPIDLPERMSELPDDQFPSLSRLAEIYSIHLSDEAFTFGLDLLIAGLQVKIANGPNA